MGQIVTRQVFVANDGTEFDFEADMLAYEAATMFSGIAEKFADEQDYSNKESEASKKRLHTTYKLHAILFAQWLKDNGCLTDNALTLSAQLQEELIAEREARRQANKEKRLAALAAKRAEKQTQSVFAEPPPAAAGMA
jgi:hypothetical protein